MRCVCGFNTLILAACPVLHSTNSLTHFSLLCFSYPLSLSSFRPSRKLCAPSYGFFVFFSSLFSVCCFCGFLICACAHSTQIKHEHSAVSINIYVSFSFFSKYRFLFRVRVCSCVKNSQLYTGIFTGILVLVNDSFEAEKEHSYWNSYELKFYPK